MPTVELLDSMGDDVSVVNAARVSYGKSVVHLGESGKRLIAYLAAHQHWTPFAHVIATLRITCNLAVAAQLKRHQVGLAVNEVSRRYVDTPPVTDVPTVWRGKSDTRKQGSGNPLPEPMQLCVATMVQRQLDSALQAYQDLLDAGVAPEMARFVLPLATVTEYIWTGSLAAFARVCNLRLAEDAQPETTAIAAGISDIMAGIAPVSWAALLGTN